MKVLLRIVCIIALLGGLALPTLSTRAALPKAAHISGMPAHAQSLSLSCEARSAADWAAFWGVKISEQKFLAMLPRSGNPETGFVGDPKSSWGDIPPHGYGVHATPVANALKKLGLQATARRNMKWDDLRAEVAAGRPVIVWIIGQMWSGTPIKYKAPDGHTVTVAHHEHTMIITGYDAKWVDVVDAYTGQYQSYSIETFQRSWSTLGNMAVIGSGPLKPAKQPTPTATSLPVKLPLHIYMPVIAASPDHKK